MGRGRRRQTRRDTAAPRRGRGPLIAAALALPVGLGAAGALVAVGETGPDAPAPADSGLAPAADDFFDGATGEPGADGSGDRAGAGGDSSGGGAQGQQAQQAEGSVSVSASADPGEGSGSGGGSGGSGGTGGSPGSGGGGGGGSAEESAVVALVNEERASAGCDPVSPDSQLAKASQDHSADMASRDYMAHDTPEGVGPGERAEEAGYTAWGGENVAAGHPTPEAVMQGWMDSPGHRANILNCDFTAIGVGETDRYWAQNFGYE